MSSLFTMGRSEVDARKRCETRSQQINLQHRGHAYRFVGFRDVAKGSLNAGQLVGGDQSEHQKRKQEKGHAQTQLASDGDSRGFPYGTTSASRVAQARVISPGLRPVL